MLAVLSAGTLAAVLALPPDTVLFEDFGAGWPDRWREKDFSFIKPNRIRVLQEDGRDVLRIDSSQSASGLWRDLSLRPGPSGRIAWRWKVAGALSGNTDEKMKAGDDYAARVFVIFESRRFSRKTRTICYVWAGTSPVGSVFPSPYSESVAMVVLQSGEGNAGRWQAEERDFVRDYRSFFNEPPKEVTGVALMADTDNTKTRTTAWFDDISIRLD
jgi:hypothetical protein